MASTVAELAKAYGDELEDAIKWTRACSFKKILPKPLKIVTISLVAMLNLKNVPLKRIVERFDHDDTQLFIKDVILETYSVSLVRPDDDKAFSNSAILKFKGDKNTIAVKIFSNGSLHITGPVSLKETEAVLGFVCGLLGVIFEVAYDSIQTRDFHVQMINSSFGIQCGLDKESVHAALRRRDMEAWIPEKHAAVTLKIRVQGRAEFEKDMVTVMVFASGEIIITGFKSGNELRAAYNTITTVLEEDFERCASKNVALCAEVIRNTNYNVHDDEEDDIMLFNSFDADSDLENAEEAPKSKKENADKKKPTEKKREKKKREEKTAEKKREKKKREEKTAEKKREKKNDVVKGGSGENVDVVHENERKSHAAAAEEDAVARKKQCVGIDHAMPIDQRFEAVSRMLSKRVATRLAAQLVQEEKNATRV